MLRRNRGYISPLLWFLATHPSSRAWTFQERSFVGTD